MLERLKSLLFLLNIQEKLTQQQVKRPLCTHIYQRSNLTITRQGLRTDCIQYLLDMVAVRGHLSENRTVVTLNTLNGQAYAVVVKYFKINRTYIVNTIKRHQWLVKRPAIEQAIVDTNFDLAQAYQTIHLQFIHPNHLPLQQLPHYQQSLSAFPLVNNSISTDSLIKAVTFSDDSPVTLIKYLMLSILKDDINSIITTTTQHWFDDLKHNDASVYRNVFNKLTAMVKYSLLHGQLERIHRLPVEQQRQAYQAAQQQVFTLSIDTHSQLLKYLQPENCLMVLYYRDSKKDLTQQVNTQYQAQQQCILQAESSLPQGSFSLSTYLWQAVTNAVSYSAYGVYSQLTELSLNLWGAPTGEGRTPRFFNLIAQGINQFITLLPRQLQFTTLPVSSPVLFKTYAKLMGMGVGLAVMGSLGWSQLLFDLTLMSIVRWFHDYLSQPIVNIEHAQIAPRMQQAPSLSVLLRITSLLLSVLMAVLANDSLFLQASLSSSVCSEIFRQTYLRLSNNPHDNSQEHAYFEFILTQLGYCFGNMVFTSYLAVTNRSNHQNHIRQNLECMLNEANLTLEHITFTSNPIDWWYEYQGFTIKYSNLQQWAEAECYGAHSNYNCTVTAATTSLKQLT